MATQIFEWIYNKHEYNVDNFSNINNDNKKYLKENFDFDFITLVLQTNLDSKKLETNSKNVKPVIPRQIKKIKANND